MSPSKVAQFPSWVVVPEGVDDEPPECKPHQLKLDDCLRVLQKELVEVEAADEELAFLDDLEEQEAKEREEEQAFLQDIGDSDEESSTPPSPPASDSESENADEPRSQVVYEHLASVRSVAEKFRASEESATILRRV
eukprot:TRINITY_DN3602_c0_g5_i1.p2 TRINITY_DN3602_c0_g5~~TRINITY_DN3602_c0_g5_i1.p2  ORF type:complete len:137 (+),score=21.41 TRINITY_DN3602_c0_g5_i1:56-466(+)